MEFTKEDYIEIGDTLSSSAVIAQTEFSLALAERDAAGLAANGWGPAKTETLRTTFVELRDADGAYTKKFGQHTASGVELLKLVKVAKKWRERAIAIGGAALSGADAAQLDLISGRTSGHPSRLASQMQSLVTIVQNHKAAFIANGADEVFITEGQTLATSLAAATAFRATRRTGLPAEHDKLDELDGRLFVMLKALNRSGRAFHKANDDDKLASEYTLSILRRR